MIDELTIARDMIVQNGSSKKAKTEQEVNKLSEEVTAGFYYRMFKSVEDTTKVNEMFGGGKAEEIFNDMLLEERSKLMAKDDVSGIKEHVKNSIQNMQILHSANK